MHLIVIAAMNRGTVCWAKAVAVLLLKSLQLNQLLSPDQQQILVRSFFLSVFIKMFDLTESVTQCLYYCSSFYTYSSAWQGEMERIWKDCTAWVILNISILCLSAFTQWMSFWCLWNPWILSVTVNVGRRTTAHSHGLLCLLTEKGRFVHPSLHQNVLDHFPKNVSPNRGCTPHSRRIMDTFWKPKQWNFFLHHNRVLIHI